MGSNTASVAVIGVDIGKEVFHIRKIRLSQNSTCEKNSWCWQPACRRSRSVKNGVKRVSHFWPQLDRSSAVRVVAVTPGQLPIIRRRMGEHDDDARRSKVYVAKVDSNTVSVIDTATDTVTATIPIG